MVRKAFVPMIVALAFVLFVVFIAGGFAMPWVLVDLPSLIIALAAPVVITVIQFGWAQTREAYAAPFSLDADRSALSKARAFFAALTRSIAAFTIFATITGAILMLANVGGTNAYPVAQGLAVALLSVLYGSLGVIFFVLPWQAVTEERLAED